LKLEDFHVELEGFHFELEDLHLELEDFHLLKIVTLSAENRYALFSKSLRSLLEIVTHRYVL
jgi:hypothetical protein